MNCSSTRGDPINKCITTSAEIMVGEEDGGAAAVVIL